MKRGLIWKLKKRLPKKHRKLLRRIAFLTLDVAIIGAVMTTLTPGLIRAETVTASESFSNTNNIDTTNTTANVDTNHTQSRLTNTDSWSLAFGIPSSVTFNAVTLANATTGWAVGSSGTIYKTADGGITWAAQTSGVSVNLTGVSAASTSVVWAVGASGTILNTTNGGTTWSAQTSGTTNALNGVSAPSTSVAYAVGASGTILNTTNGGTTWSAQTSGTTNALNGVSAAYDTSVTPNAFSTSLVYAVGASGTILKTTNSGTTWSAQTSGTTNALNGVFGSNLLDATTVGDAGTILGTGNAGNTWISRTAPNSENIKAVSFYFDVGQAPASFMTTANGGIFHASTSTVTTVISNVAVSLNGIAGVPPGNSSTLAVVVGASGTIARNTSANSASTSYAVVSGTAAAGFNAGSCASSTTCWAVGDSGVILTSSDSGATWSSQTSGTTNALRGVKMVSTSVGWAVGDSGTILKISNGTSWSAQTSGIPTALRAVDAASTSVAWTVGASGIILKTTDGATWISQTSGVAVQLNTISAPSTTVAWVAGASGTVLLTTDGGTTWTTKTTGVSVSLNGIAGIDSSTAYVLGASGTILKTTNGGSSWSTLTSGTVADLTAVAALDTNTIRATGAGLVLQSTNAGSTWSSIATGTVSATLTYSAITHPAINVGVIAGQGYTILRYIPSYSASALIVVSQNRNSTSTNIASATLTATSTLNSQTITYALSNDAGTTYNTVTSGTAYTFGTTGADLRWRATLSTADTSATPILTAISISAETSGSSSSSSSVKDNYNDQNNSPAKHAPWPNPGPIEPTILSSSSIRWNFSPAGKGGVRLLKRVPGGSARDFTELTRVIKENLTSIDDTGLTPNSTINDRMIQYIPTADEAKLADADLPRELPTVTLPPATPPAPELVKLEEAIATIRIRDGGNVAPVSFAIQDALSGKWLGEGRTLSVDAALYKTVAEWSETADGTARILGLTANTSYAIRIKARGVKNVETDFSPSLGFTTSLEAPATIVQTKSEKTEVIVEVKSVREDGAFSNLTLGSSGILIENTTAGTSSGWIQATIWKMTGLAAGTDYALRVRTRRNDAVESAVSPTITVTTAGTNEQEKKQAEEEKKREQVEKEKQRKEAAEGKKRAEEEKRAVEEVKKKQEQPTRRREEQPVKEETPLPTRQQEPQAQPTFSSVPEENAVPALLTPPPIEFGGGGSQTTPTFGSTSGSSRRLTPRTATINGIPIDPSAAAPRLRIDPKETPELVISGQSEPTILVSVIIESEPLLATTRSDEQGNWAIRIATALIPDAPEHTVFVQAGSGETASAKVAIASLEVKKPPVQQLSDTAVTIAGVFAETTIRIVDTTTRATVETTKQVATATKIVAKKIEPQAQITLTTVIPIVVAFNPPLWALLPQLPVLLTNLITWLLTLLGIRKRRLPWGMVYDAVSKEPIALAIVRVFDPKTNRILETQVTDRLGRFGIMLLGGTYRLEVTKGNYRFPSQIVHTNEDGLFTNVYRGGNASIPADGSLATISIPLDPEEQIHITAKQRTRRFIFELRKTFRKLSPFLLWSGTASGFVLAAASPTPFNVTVGALYLGLAIIDQLARPKALRSWGRVVEASSGAPISLATVDLIDLKYNRLLRSRLTDAEGRFMFLAPPGQYKIQARKEGYTQTLKSKPIRGVRHLYIGSPIAVTAKAPTISVTLALEKTNGKS